MTDPISDMLARIRNASLALLPTVEMPYSRIKEGIGHILVKEGYVAECTVEGKPARTIKLKLKYLNRKGIIDGLRRISKPGLRHYAGSTEIPRVRGGLGIIILSTSHGLMTGTDARKNNVGGELLCSIW